jgi:hypothetical protein
MWAPSAISWYRGWDVEYDGCERNVYREKILIRTKKYIYFTVQGEHLHLNFIGGLLSKPKCYNKWGLAILQTQPNTTLKGGEDNT